MKYKRLVSLITCLAFALTASMNVYLQPEEASAASPVSVTLQQCEALALAHSSQYQTKLFAYNRLCKSYQNALKTVKAKWKDYGTIRWSLLFSISFPSTPYMDEALDLYTKGPGIMVDINSAIREMYDIEKQVKNKVDTLFIQAYQCQEQAKFTEKLLESTQRTLKQNKARLARGKAKQSDIEKTEKKIADLEKKLVKYLKGFTSKMKNLKKQTNVDMISGYKLINPCKTAKLSAATHLSDLQNYALYWDLEVYNSDLDVQMDKLTVNLEMQLLQRYGWKSAVYVSPYVNRILAGESVNPNVFSASYDEFLKQIDEPWDGKYKILFIKIPKEWFKRKLSGSRYIENAQYAPMDDALTLQGDIKTNADLRAALLDKVEQAFEAAVDGRTAYLNATDSTASAKKNLSKVNALNKIGGASYEETQDADTAYQDAQMSELEALCTYTDLLYALDRLCYGGVRLLLNGESIALDSGGAGLSFADAVDENKAYYYIQPMVQHQAFLFGVTIPSGFDPQITHYELWYGDYQLGKRTPIDKQIVHMTFTYADSNTLTLRLYNSGKYVGEVKVDANEPMGEINLEKTPQKEEIVEKVVGTFKVSDSGNIDIAAASISFDMKKSENAVKYYTIVTDKGKPLIKDKKLPISKKFNYLSLMSGELGMLRVRFFDENQELLYTAEMNEDTMSLVVKLKVSDND
ncbi:MAG: hypothetical protein K6F52_06835 [Clostridia bacterium]|nr:hypothetical protein [Clostridia bacterium]